MKHLPLAAFLIAIAALATVRPPDTCYRWTGLLCSDRPHHGGAFTLSTGCPNSCAHPVRGWHFAWTDRPTAEEWDRIQRETVCACGEPAP